MRKIKSFYFNFYRGIRNLIIWFPLIWTDRNYDWNPIMRMLEKKLHRMSILHDKHGYAENSDEVAEQLLHASRLAGRIASEDYTTSIRELPEFHGRLLDAFDHNESWNVNKKSSDKEMKLLIDIGTKEEELLQKDIEELFNLMKKYLRNWWD